MIEEEEDLKYTKFNNNNKKEIFAQLKDLFGELVTSNTLNDICLKQNWQVENCINDIINYIENSKKDKIANSNDNEWCIFNQKMMNETEMMNYQYGSADDVVIESEEISSMPSTVPDTEGNSLPIPIDIEPSMQQRKLGAIPKVGNIQYRTINDNFISGSDKKSLDFSKIIQQDFKNFENTSRPNVFHRKREETTAINSLEVQNIIRNIQLDYKVMIIMRGPPGCGKSFLAKYIVSQTVGNDFRNYIFSSDDYFYNVNDQYVYDRNKIHFAHDFNQKRVRKKALEGWSPIIIDNTNIKIWEMFPYAQLGVQNGYIIHILYPENDWCNSVSKLFARNQHGVPKESIKRMLDSYEPCSVNQLLKASRVMYCVPMPQYRHFPPLKKDLLTNDQIFKSFDTFNICEERDKIKSVANTDSENLTNERDIQKENSTKISNFESLNSIPFWPEFKGFKGIEEIEKPNVNEQNEIKIDEIKSEAKLTDSKAGISNVELNESISGIVTTDQRMNYEKTSHNYVEDSKEDGNSSKPQRNNSRTRRYQLKAVELPEETIVIPEVKDSEWKSYEEESKEFWSSNQTNVQYEQQNKLDLIDLLSNEPKPKRSLNKTTENLISVLKEINDNNFENNKKNINENLSINRLEKHKLGCPNESQSFVMLRQIYQNKQLDGLWDLFEKCNGDVYWAVDILIKDDDTCVDQQVENSINLDQYFVCHCDEVSDKQILKENQEKESSTSENLQRNKVKKDKTNTLSNEMLEAKLAIEKQFVLPEQYYSEHVKKIRDIRHGILDNNDQDSQNVIAATTVDVATINPNTFQLDNPSNDIHIMDNMDIENENEAEEVLNAETEDIVEIDLGKELVQQLNTIFNTDTNVNIPLSDFKTNVFMPKSLAQQLYAIWMESFYNQMEEQKQIIVKEDEELARFLQNPVNSTVCSDPEPPKTLKEVMEMELAWSIYKSNAENWKKFLPKNLASILTRKKLFEMFPNIEEDTLCQILNANGNKFGDTVKDLHHSLKSDLDENIQEKAVDLLKKAKDESEMNSTNTQMQSSKQSVNQSRRSQITGEEAKQLALKDFEENRNLAAHHTQLKAECYRRAKDAIQGKAHGIALYYSQIANLHKSKIDKYNQTAANCIMEIQNLNQNNPDLIDLHYLHVMEAIECLDVFIDKQITELKKICKRYKFIFIITGRGLHSAGGISAIKNKVKGRLKERYLTWSEVNPGLLKVKIYSASRYSENL